MLQFAEASLKIRPCWISITGNTNISSTKSLKYGNLSCDFYANIFVGNSIEVYCHKKAHLTIGALTAVGGLLTAPVSDLIPKSILPRVIPQSSTLNTVSLIQDVPVCLIRKYGYPG